MKKLLICGIIISLLSYLCYAQKYHNNHIYYKNFSQKESKLFFNISDTLFGRAEDAKNYIINQKEKFGLPVNTINLKLKSEKHSLIGRHLKYQQFIDSIPVEGAELTISLNKKGEIIASGHSLYDFGYISKQRGISEDKALDIAWNYLHVNGNLKSMPRTELYYIPYSDSLLLCYKVYINTESPVGYWGLNIDAGTGEILEVYETVIYEKIMNSRNFYNFSGSILPKKLAVKNYTLNISKRNKMKASSFLTQNNGTAKVFDPDPMTALNNANLQDSFPADSFTNAYVTRTLYDLTKTNGIYYLTGPWVDIEAIQGPNTTPNTAPSTSTTGNWTATRGNNAFNDVMTYFHIDQNQRYVQSLGYTGDYGIQNLSIEADADACNGDDNSFYYPAGNYICYGHGGVDDNEDAGVILHEYMHALLNYTNSDFSSSFGDVGAMNEGFADYWGGSYCYSTTNGSTFHPNWFAKWDGHSLKTGNWHGRDLDRTDLMYENRNYCAHCDSDKDDEIWSAPLFQSMIDIINQGGNRQQMDRIVLESGYGLGAYFTMRQMAEVVVNTADNLYPNNIHAPILLTRFSNQNFLLHDIYVDSNYSGTEDGSETKPFNTIGEGYNAVLPGGTLRVSSGNYQIGNLVLNKRMIIEAEGGTITIGY